jgi:hypothetical protein
MEGLVELRHMPADARLTLDERYRVGRREWRVYGSIHPGSSAHCPNNDFMRARIDEI